MSTNVFTDQRTTERLSFFKEKIEQTDPIDNYFKKTPTLDALMKKKKMISGGRQYGFPVDLGSNSTVKWFKDYDTFDTTAQDSARVASYAYKNLGGTLVVSWEELRESNGSENAWFDLVKHRRSNLVSSAMTELNNHLHSATFGSDEIDTIPSIISATGSTGELSASAYPTWASVVEAAVGSFSTNAIAKMNSVCNQILLNKGMVDTVIMPRDLYEAYEKDALSDVQYVSMDKAERSFKGITYRGNPITFDDACAAGTIYLLDSDYLTFKIDSDANFKIDDFERPYNQKAFIATMAFRGNLMTTSRRCLGKLTGVTV